MKYQLDIPKEPDGPVWDQPGHKFEKTNNGTWKGKYYGETYEYSWYSLLQTCGPLTDTPVARRQWESAIPGAYYWIRGYDSLRQSNLNGIGCAKSTRNLVCFDSDKSDFGTILQGYEDDDLTERTPILAVPADDLIELFSTDEEPIIDHLQAKIYDWLEDHPQVHWEERSK